MIIRNSLRAVVATALFVVNATSQSGTRTAEPRDRTERTQQDRETDAKGPKARMPKERERLHENGGEQSPAQPGGETRPGEREMTPMERARGFLERHPEIRERAFAKADVDHDGKLSSAERVQMKRLLLTAIREMQKKALEKAAARQQERADQREQRGEDLDEQRRKRSDLDDAKCDIPSEGWDIDGTGQLRERRGEKTKEPTDRKDDGAAPAERERAQGREKAKEREQSHKTREQKRSRNDEKSSG